MTEKLISLLFLLFSITYLWFARELSFGIIAAPKAGFLPTISGVAAVGLAFVLFVKQLLQKQAEDRGTDKINWRKCIFIILGLMLYVTFLYLTGYIVATFILMFYLLKVTETAGWTKPLVISTGISIGFYLLFAMFLGTNLP